MTPHFLTTHVLLRDTFASESYRRIDSPVPCLSVVRGAGGWESFELPKSTRIREGVQQKSMHANPCKYRINCQSNTKKTNQHNQKPPAGSTGGLCYHTLLITVMEQVTISTPSVSSTRCTADIAPIYTATHLKNFNDIRMLPSKRRYFFSILVALGV